MVEEITKQNYFEWNGKTYCNPKGLPMGGPLSALLAEIYLQQFEKNNILTPTNPHHRKILFYRRYVDDSFIVFKGTKRQANVFLKYLNNIHNSIKFKMELEDNNCLNFLDVKITKVNNSNYEFGIYRKPTQTDLVIPKNSNHPYQYKLSAFRSMIYRLLTYNLCSREFEKEKNIIKQIAFNNGYDIQLIDNLIRKTKYNLHKPQDHSINKKYIPFCYVNKFSETIGNIFKNNGFQPGYKLNRKPIQGEKQSIDKKQDKGVYLIECNNGDKCDKKYVGYTNRSFYQRFKEHNATKQVNPTSIVAQHLQSNKGHKIDFEKSLSVLKSCGQKNKAKVWEELFIFQHMRGHGNDTMLNKREEYSDKITYQLFCDVDNKTGNKNRQSADTVTSLSRVQVPQ